MRQRTFSLGLVPVASFLVACAEPQTTAPANVANLAASAQQLAAPPGCEHASGAFVFTSFQFTSQTTAVGAGTLQGDLSGGFSAEYFDIQQRASMWITPLPRCWISKYSEHRDDQDVR